MSMKNEGCDWPEVSPAVKRLRFDWSTVTHELYRIPVSFGHSVVVVGDPNNGCYEWMIEVPTGIEQYSNSGYGCSEAALRDGLVAYLGAPSETTAPPVVLIKEAA